MGIGQAMAGGGPAEDRQRNDHYPTPPDVTRALLARHDFDGTIHECACGTGVMSMVLQIGGYQVVSTDIAPQGFGRKIDFFTIEEPLADNIVTNPPFSLAQRFIEHSLDVLRPRKLALVLKSTYFHAKSRAALFEKRPPSFVHPLLWRPDFMGLGRPTMEIMWAVWDEDHDGPTVYEPMPRPPANDDTPLPPDAAIALAA